MTAMVGLYTRVIKQQDGYVIVVPPGKEYKLQEGEAEIHGVRNIKISIPLDDAVGIDLEVLAGGIVQTTGKARWFAKDPRDGVVREIRNVEFADAPMWDG